MSGSGMISGRIAGLIVDDEFAVLQPRGCTTIDDKSEPGSWAHELEWRGNPLGCVSAIEPVVFGIDFTSDYLQQVRADERRHIALGIICHAAAKCTDVSRLADRGAIDRDSADLFIRRYCESINDIVALIVSVAPQARKKTNIDGGN